MNKFIYQIEKNEEKEAIELILFSSDSNLKTHKEKVKVPYTLYTLKEAFSKLKIKTDSLKVIEGFKNKNQDDIVRLEFYSKDLYSYVLDQIKTKELPLYEQDLNPEHAYLIDNDLSIYNTKNTKIPSLKYISIDIETIGKGEEDQEIVLISSYSANNSKVNKVFVNKEKIPAKQLEKVSKFKPQGYTLEIRENEKETLEAFRNEIIEFEPQIIIGWNVVEFDFKVIRERMKALGIPFEFSKENGEGKLRVRKNFFSKSTLTFPGILVFDGIQLLKTNFVEFDDFKLNTVSQAVLGSEKIDLEDEGDADLGIENKMEAINNMVQKNTVKLIEYNFKDSLLTAQILEKLNILSLTYERSIITGTPLNKIHSPIASLDIMYLKRLHKKKYVAETNFNFTDMGSISGAYVLSPKSGFYEDVFVMDFSSLYPSIIMTFNIDPFTYNEEGPIIAPNDAKFSKENGILPTLIDEVYSMRLQAKEKKNQTKSHALKITMNSFYGAMASPKSRYYNKHLAEAITSFGQTIIKEAAQFVKNEGHNVIYGDTDSIFIQSKDKFDSYSQKIKFSDDLREKINEYFKGWTREKYGCESKLTMDIEKVFSKFFIASKKRYVGLDEESKELKFTGMEAIRGDWTQLAREFQIKLVELIFEYGKDKEKIKSFIEEEISKLTNGEFDDKLIYKKKITKPLQDYTKTTPPHVKAAREVKNFQGRIVRYVLTKQGPKHISLVNSHTELDYEHYIDKQLKGVSDDLLDALDLDFDEIINNKKQKSLESFF